MVVLLLLLGAPGWEEVNVEDGVRVELRKLGPRQTLVRGTVTLPYSWDEVVATLKDLEGFERWIPSLATWTVLDKRSRSAFVYARHDLPWPMDDRDYVIRYAWKTGKDQTFRLRARSTDKRSDAPSPKSGVIRLDRVQSEWTVTAVGGDRAVIQYTYNGQLGGDIPQSVKLSTWKSEPPKLFQALQAELQRRRAAR